MVSKYNKTEVYQ